MTWQRNARQRWLAFWTSQISHLQYEDSRLSSRIRKSTVSLGCCSPIRELTSSLECNEMAFLQQLKVQVVQGHQKLKKTWLVNDRCSSLFNNCHSFYVQWTTQILCSGSPQALLGHFTPCLETARLSRLGMADGGCHMVFATRRILSVEVQVHQGDEWFLEYAWWQVLDMHQKYGNWTCLNYIFRFSPFMSLFFGSGDEQVEGQLTPRMCFLRCAKIQVRSVQKFLSNGWNSIWIEKHIHHLGRVCPLTLVWRNGFRTTNIHQPG